MQSRIGHFGTIERRNNFNLAEPVHIGSGNALVAETSHISDAHVVHHDVEHIGTIAG